jgi:MFS family permease
VLFRFLDVYGRDRPSRLRHNLRLCTADACTATPLVFLTVGGNFILASLITQVYRIDNQTYGWISSLPSWCNALQIALVAGLARGCTSRQLSLGGAVAHALVWGIIAVGLPWLPRDDPHRTARALLVALALASMAQSFASVGWTSWVQEWLPRRLWGKYFGARNRASSLATVAFFVFVGWTTSQLADAVFAYQLIFGVTTLLRVMSCIWQSQMVTTPLEQSALIYLGWRGQLSRLARERDFVRFVIYGSVTAFVINLASPFYPVFAYESLRLSVDQYALLVLLATLGGAIAWPWWGRFTDQHGCRNAIILSLATWSFTDLWWPFLHAGHALWPLYFVWLWGGGASCGFLVGTFNWLLKLVPTQARVAGVSLNLALTSLMTAIAPILAGSWLDSAHAVSPARAEWTFRALFLAKPLLQLAALILLRGIAEPANTRFQSLLGAMRSQRQLLASQVSPVLANFLSFRPPRGGRDRSDPPTNEE